MRHLPTLMAVVLCLASGMPNAHADDDATLSAVIAAFNAIDAAFGRKDTEALESMMTADHLAIAPYYDGPKDVAGTLDTLDDLKTKETPVSKMTVTMLGPEAAMITFVATMDGSFKGAPLPARGFVTAIMVRRDGRWLEKQYQLTGLEP